MDAWHFLHVPKKESEEIKKNFGKNKRGFGSIRVEATLGKEKWQTSIFPDKKSGTYILPLKIEVRRREGIRAKDTVSFSLKIVN